MKHQIYCIFETQTGYQLSRYLTKDELLTFFKAQQEFYLNEWCDDPKSESFSYNLEITGITFSLDYTKIIDISFREKGWSK